MGEISSLCSFTICDHIMELYDSDESVTSAYRAVVSLKSSRKWINYYVTLCKTIKTIYNFN